jgi:hypothetical protein
MKMTTTKMKKVNVLWIDGYNNTMQQRCKIGTL